MFEFGVAWGADRPSEAGSIVEPGEGHGALEDVNGLSLCPAVAAWFPGRGLNSRFFCGYMVLMEGVG
ncbi:hypothetical protein N7463_001607 [Penicillium fimorum]|uniref:Uncharacterized protein n=1 Tax=Penicillium fimorum TaxID=1882269 RepID=A0A9W9XYV1_9EURO|nr:hypothetical protein N7463_001607 [Penicillium fimorum]